MYDFKDKNILLIMPKYFNYEVAIKKYIEEKGGNVRLIYENLDYINPLYNLVMRCSKLKKRFTKKYYCKHINTFVPDLILVIRGDTLYEDTVRELRNKFPKARFCLYQWDSVQNNPNALKIAPYFDKVASFDMGDAEKYGWKYRPLFFLKDIQYSHNREYDYAFICSLHSQRYKIYRNLIMNNSEYKGYIYLFSDFFHFFSHKYLKRDKIFQTISSKDVMFKSLSPNDIDKIMSKTKIIVDYTHPNQNGFTMRTIESLGYKCKLITNNERILQADFYSPDNIFVYHGNEFHIPSEFINSNYKDLDTDIYSKYTLEKWLLDIVE